MKHRNFGHLGSLAFHAEKNLLKIIRNNHSSSNKRHLRADVLSLRSSALRPRLLRLPVILLSMFVLAVCVSLCSSSIVLADHYNEGHDHGTDEDASTTSLTLTIPSSPLSLDLNPSVDNGFATTSGSFNVKTDNESGYTVSIKSKSESGDNSLINGNNKLTSITESTSEDGFRNDPKFINMWGWLPNKLNSEDNTSYQVAPGAEDVVLDSTGEANSEEQDYDISLAAKVSTDTRIGSYSNNFIISAIANEVHKFDETTMQGWTGCSDLSIGSSVTLTDARDNSTYTIAKLKDERCWMTQDLKLGKDPNITLNPYDSNVDSKFTLPKNDVNQFLDDLNNTSPALYYHSSYDTTYYNWYTATAGGDNIKEFIAAESICPKGWHLPSKDEAFKLSTLYDYYSFQNSPAYFSRSGRIYNKKIERPTRFDGRWTSALYACNQPDPSKTSGAYTISFYTYPDSNPTTFELQDIYWDTKYIGYPLRCVDGDRSFSTITFKAGDNIDRIIVFNPSSGKTYAIQNNEESSIEVVKGTQLGIRVIPKPYHILQSWTRDSNNGILEDEKLINTLYTVNGNERLEAIGMQGSYTYIQDYPTTNCTETGNNVTDSRDGKSYSIAKLKDGKCWMTQNLELGGETSINLTPQDSDVSNSNFTLPAINPNWMEGESYNQPFNKAGVYTGLPWGGYYTWFAATAGTSAQASRAGANASGSICPKGWKLPTGGNNGDYQKMAQAYNDNYYEILKLPAPGFDHLGIFNGNGDLNLFVAEAISHYATSTFNGESPYIFGTHENSFDAIDDYPSYYGKSIRCIKR